MKLLRITLTMATAVLLYAQAGATLQRGIRKETIEGDLKGAIQLYEKAFSQAGSDRATAAAALLRMGECHEKLGNAEARKAYERLLKEFADSKEAMQARSKLAAPGGAHSGMTYRQVWSGPKVDSYGRVSPDGRYLSFVDWETGDLALHDFVANTDRRLTNKGTWAQSDDFAEESVISRDGSQVAYAWYKKKDNRYELRIATIGKSGPAESRRLFDSEAMAWIGPCDWSPDGLWLAVKWSEKKGPGTFHIGLVSTRDGSLRVLKPRVPGSIRQSFSPDGRFLGIDVLDAKTSGRQVVVLAIDGSAEIKAVADPGQNLMMGWSPDGKRLLFASDRRGSLDLWALPVADGKPQGAPELVRPDIAPWPLGVTASGALYLGVNVSDMDINVASLNFQTGEQLSPPTRPIQSYIGRNTQPEWSPDGKHLAYVSARNRAPTRADQVLGIRSLETGQVRELRPNLRMFNYPRWAPDGRSFVCQGVDNGGRQGIFRIDAESGEASTVVLSPQTGGLQKPQWSVDGKKIYYVRRNDFEDNVTLIERDLASGTEREMIRRNRRDLGMVSPDARCFATEFRDPGKSETIRLVPTDGGEYRELLQVTHPEALHLLGWMPDGQGLMVRKTSPGGAMQVLLVSVADGRHHKLDINTRFAPFSLARVHPDGRQIAYMSGEQNQEVWVLENFLRGNKAAR